MSGFSELSKRTIERVARDMGVDAQGLDQGSVSFALSHSGVLSFTSSNDGARLLVSLARQPRYAEDALDLAFLAQAGFDSSEGRFLHAGLSDDGWLVAAVSLDEPEFDAPAVDLTIQRLIRMMDDCGVR